MATWPDIAIVRAWAGVPEAELSDDQLQLILDAEMDLQAAYCVGVELPDAPEPLVQALLRRCARAIAARGLPLGTLPAAVSGVGAEYGLAVRSMTLPRLDAEVERYEAPFRQVATA